MVVVILLVVMVTWLERRSLQRRGWTLAINQTFGRRAMSGRRDVTLVGRLAGKYYLSAIDARPPFGPFLSLCPLTPHSLSNCSRPPFTALSRYQPPLSALLPNASVTFHLPLLLSSFLFLGISVVSLILARPIPTQVTHPLPHPSSCAHHGTLLFHYFIPIHPFIHTLTHSLIFIRFICHGLVCLSFFSHPSPSSARPHFC